MRSAEIRGQVFAGKYARRNFICMRAKSASPPRAPILGTLNIKENKRSRRLLSRKNFKIYMKIALAQTAVIRGEFEKNLDRAAATAKEAAAQSAELVVFPEMFVSGFDYKKNAEFLEKHPREIEERLSDIAAGCSVALAGSFPHIETGWRTPSNRLALYASDGRELAHYDKIHLFGVFHEDRFVTPGKSAIVNNSHLGKIGFAVCYDIRFPELFMRLADMGAKLIIICAAFPHPRSEHWRILCRARAIENQCYVAAVNQCGPEVFRGGSVKYCGMSAVFDPWGEIVAECPPDEENLAFADIDLGLVDEIRARIPVFSDRRPIG